MLPVQQLAEGFQLLQRGVLAGDKAATALDLTQHHRKYNRYPFYYQLCYWLYPPPQSSLSKMPSHVLWSLGSQAQAMHLLLLLLYTMIYDQASKSQIIRHRHLSQSSQVFNAPLNLRGQIINRDETKSQVHPHPKQQQNCLSNNSKGLVKLMMQVKLDGFGFEQTSIINQIDEQIQAFDEWSYIRNTELNDLAEFLAAQTITKMFIHIFGNSLANRITSRRNSVGRFNSETYVQQSQDLQQYMVEPQAPIQIIRQPWQGQLPYDRGHVDILCQICYTYSSQYVTDDCGHSFCQDCMRAYLRQSIVNGNYLISCPQYECEDNVSTEIIKKMLSETQFDRFQYFLEKTKQQMDPQNKFCSRPDCGQVLSKFDHKYFCPKCQIQYCQICLQPFHEGRDCNTTLKNALEHTYSVYRIKKCPKCNSPIEKSQGCNHMVCKKCKYEFCWLCLGKYTKHHYRYYNCCGCPGMLFEDEDNQLAQRSKQICFWTLLPMALIIIIIGYLCFVPVYMIGTCLYSPLTWVEEQKDYCQINLVKYIFCCQGIAPNITAWILLQPRALLYGIFISPFKLTMMLCHEICRNFE